MTATCPSTIHDGHETVRCALGPHDDTTDHRRGYLAWDNQGRWWAQRDIPDLYPAIGALLRDARQRRGLNQLEVAASVNLTRGSIANIEAGRQRIQLHTWVAMCQLLGADPADVISRALQATGPDMQPISSQDDKQAAQLRRQLRAAHRDIGRLLDTLTPATERTTP